MAIHPVISAVTERIRRRSQPTRQAYLARMTDAQGTGPVRKRLPCGNLAHACAALSVALQRCAAEAALLVADEELARIYLKNLGLPTSA